jgi:hypothetical protein
VALSSSSSPPVKSTAQPQPCANVSSQPSAEALIVVESSSFEDAEEEERPRPVCSAWASFVRALSVKWVC